jgi:lipoyl-dependent peroxiredoxin
MDSTSTVVWQGSLKAGQGRITTESGVLNEAVYTYGTRFENNPGTNPEELIAAAHAGCFTMALANGLGEAGITPEQIKTVAKVTLSTQNNDFKITQIHLNVTGKLSGGDQHTFEKVAQSAKENCPVSKLLNADISMEACIES